MKNSYDASKDFELIRTLGTNRNQILRKNLISNVIGFMKLRENYRFSTIPFTTRTIFNKYSSQKCTNSYVTYCKLPHNML